MDDKIKVTLISTYRCITSEGIRLVSSYLKENGHSVNLIFLSDYTSPNQYCSNETHDKLHVLCKDSDLIGLTVMTNTFFRAKDVTINLKKKLDVPIIWGGVHPTVRPEECLKFADMVCMGEGEEAMLELANRLTSEDITHIENIWIKKNNEIIRNDVRPLVENLDKYPFQDYDISTHYIESGNTIMKMSEQLLEKNMPIFSSKKAYQMITTRGCPYSCTYCCNNVFRKLYYKKGRYVRQRSIEHIIKEIEVIKNKYEFFNMVSFKDDVFFVRREENIKRFCQLYKKRVNLPMRCIFSPQYTNENKIKFMIDAGLVIVSMGIQSFSEKTLYEIYKRYTTKEQISSSVRILDKYKSKLEEISVHFIKGNPYESKKSRKETIRFINSLPDYFIKVIFKLVLFPGTELYERAKKDGIIKDEYNEIYLNREWAELNPDYSGNESPHIEWIKKFLPIKIINKIRFLRFLRKRDGNEMIV